MKPSQEWMDRVRAQMRRVENGEAKIAHAAAALCMIPSEFVDVYVACETQGRIDKLEAERDRLQAERAALIAENETLRSMRDLKSRSNARMFAFFVEIAELIGDDPPESGDHLPALMSVLKFTLERHEADRSTLQRQALQKIRDHVGAYADSVAGKAYPPTAFQVLEKLVSEFDEQLDALVSSPPSPEQPLPSPPVATS